MPTRRAWLLCAASTILGSGAGYALGSLGARGGGAPTPATTPDLGTSDPGDVTLAWLLELAKPQTPIDELLENLGAFVYLVPRRYPRHATLWDAMGRMADELLSGPRTQDRRRGARDLAICFEAHASAAGRADLAAKAPALRSLGGR